MFLTAVSFSTSVGVTACSGSAELPPIDGVAPQEIDCDNVQPQTLAPGEKLAFARRTSGVLLGFAIENTGSDIQIHPPDSSFMPTTAYTFDLLGDGLRLVDVPATDDTGRRNLAVEFGTFNAATDTASFSVSCDRLLPGAENDTITS